MKKILISISLLLSTLNVANAQQVQVLDSPPDWTFMMSNLNTSQITSGVLYNKVAMFNNLYDYNRGRYNMSHAEHFFQGINELHYASDQTKFVSAAQLKLSLIIAPSAPTQAMSTQAIAIPIDTGTSATVNIGIINTTLYMLNFNEKNPATGGLTFVNGKFAPITGQPNFLSRKILLASPLQEMASGTSVKYRFANNRIYNNATTIIKKLVVYFNDQTPVTIINNSILLLTSKTISYATSGDKTLKFEATFTDNSVITTVGYHNFVYKSSSIGATTTFAPCEDAIIERGVFKSTIGFQGYDEPTEYLGKFDYTVFYHTLNNAAMARTMLKPILIIDGFDPNDKRKTTDCDCEKELTEGGCFEKNSDKVYTYTAGISLPSGSVKVFNPTNHESIFDLMQYPVNGQPVNLVTKLRAEGYDVIILNIPKYNTSAVGSTIENKTIDGGADYVERNGRTLASYIQNLKATLLQNNSTQNLVIMGPSMGGLISRYALAYMEKKEAEATTQIEKDKWKHNTRIWVSFDSPHLGANIPMGAQANIWFFGNKLRNSSAEEKFNNELNSYAGRQMIIDQFSNTLATMSNNTGQSNNSPYFVQFQNNLNSNGVAGSGGFPVSNATFRKIAIVNGSLAGVKNGVEGGEFLNIRGYKDPTFVEGLIGGAVAGSILPGFGTISGAIFGSLLGASNANVTLLRCRDKFYPAYGQTDDIFNGDGQNFTIGWSQWYINHKWYNLRGTNNSIKGSLDIVPAGTFTTGKILKDEIIKGLNDAGLSHELRGSTVDTHSFIPAFSALAHLQPNQSWSNPLNTNLTCSSNKQTPFDSYFGATSNTPHITLTKDMVDWLMKELGDSNNPPTPQAPSFPVDTNLLLGPDRICAFTHQTYYFDNICDIPSTPAWSINNMYIEIISSTNTSITIMANRQTSFTIIATFENGNRVLKYGWVGEPGAPLLAGYNCTPDSPNFTCYPATVQISSNAFPHNNYGIINALSLHTIMGYDSTTDVDSSWEWVSESDNIHFTGFGHQDYTSNQRIGYQTFINFKNQIIPSQIKFKCRYKNDCGWSVYRHFVINFPGGYTPPSTIKYFVMSPNPASTFTNVILQDSNVLPNNTGHIIAKMYNSTGLLVKTEDVTSYPRGFDLNGLPFGVYIIKITFDNHVETHSIFKNI